MATAGVATTAVRTNASRRRRPVLIRRSSSPGRTPVKAARPAVRAGLCGLLRAVFEQSTALCVRHRRAVGLGSLAPMYTTAELARLEREAQRADEAPSTLRDPRLQALALQQSAGNAAVARRLGRR